MLSHSSTSCEEFMDLTRDGNTLTHLMVPERPTDAHKATCLLERETIGEQGRFQLPENVCTNQ